MDLNPFDWTAGPFLMLYGALLLLAIVVGALIPRWLRPEGHDAEPGDAEALAVLAGGLDRLADTVTGSLLAQGGLRLEKQRFTVTGRMAGGSAAERALLGVPPQSKWTRLKGALMIEAMAIELRLVDRGLLMSMAEQLQMRFFQTLPYLLLLGFGLIRRHFGILRDRPVGFLTILLGVTAVLAIIRFMMLERRTRCGIAVVASLRARMDRLRRAPTASETGLAVALFGTGILVLSPLDEFHRLRARGDGDSSGGGCGSSGGGGSGGGGCGGCGD